MPTIRVFVVAFVLTLIMVSPALSDSFGKGVRCGEKFKNKSKPSYVADATKFVLYEPTGSVKLSADGTLQTVNDFSVTLGGVSDSGERRRELQARLRFKGPRSSAKASIRLSDSDGCSEKSLPHYFCSRVNFKFACKPDKKHSDGMLSITCRLDAKEHTFNTSRYDPATRRAEECSDSVRASDNSFRYRLVLEPDAPGSNSYTLKGFPDSGSEDLLSRYASWIGG